MPSPSDVRDPATRASLEEAGRLLDEGDYPACVRLSADVYMRFAQQHPDLVVRAPEPGQPVNAAGGVVGGRARAWPSLLGVALVFEDGRPSLRFNKERFSMSEAATYFEYTVEQVVHAQAEA